jgi:hypothetical protein
MMDQPVQPLETTPGGAPSEPRRRFRIQFSLFSLLLLIALAASLFALLRDTRAWVPGMVVTNQNAGKYFNDPCFTNDGQKVIVSAGPGVLSANAYNTVAYMGIEERETDTWLLLDAGTGRRLAEYPVPKGSWAGFLQDGRYLHAADEASCILISDPGDPGRTTELKGFVGRPNRIRQSADGGRVLCVSSYGSAHVWDSRTGHKECDLDTRRFDFSSAEAYRTADISPDGKHVAALVRVRSPGDRLCVWNADTGALTANLPNRSGKTHRLGSFRFVLRGTRVLTNSSRTALGVFNVDNEQPVAFWPGPDAGAAAGAGLSLDDVVISPDGSRLLYCSRAPTPKAWEWDIPTGRTRGVQWCNPDSTVSRVEFLPVFHFHYAMDNSRMVSDSQFVASSARIMDPETGQTLATLTVDGKIAGEHCSPFSPDGRRVAVIHSDGTLRVWTRRRPEAWWGIAALPELWTAILAAAALAVILVRRLTRKSFPPLPRQA